MEELIIPKFQKKESSTTGPQMNGGNRICPTCNGTGWKLYQVSPRELEYVYGGEDYANEYAKRCPDCFGLNKNEDKTGTPDVMREADFYKFKWDAYGVDTSKLKQVAESFFKDFKKWSEKGKGLYIFSKTPGSGKTFLSVCLAKSVMMSSGTTYKFITASGYIDKVSEGYALKKQSVFDNPSAIYKECGLLVLDDIGTQIDKPWQQQELFELINTRLTRGLVTIYTSNYPVEKLNVDERIKSRIDGSTISFPMPDVSIRKNKNDTDNNNFLRGVLEKWTNDQ